MKDINYDSLRKNIDEMINILEYDGMRSAGKIKMNAGVLNELLALKEHYAEPVKKPAPKKEA